jgi:putative ATP-dependent endonuclease of OLD family
MHMAVQLALETNDLELPITKSIFSDMEKKVQEDFKKWSDEAKSDSEIAVEIYAPLERNLASKAVTAQIFARIFPMFKIPVQDILDDENLKYIVDAIKYAAYV